jgi:DNA-directed RNA polymerase specialized sigma24 family protein
VDGAVRLSPLLRPTVLSDQKVLLRWYRDRTVEAGSNRSRRPDFRPAHRGAVARGLAELGDKEAATLQLFFFEGCELREVAERLGESLGNTRHYYYRDLERLRRTAIAMAVRNEKS